MTVELARTGEGIAPPELLIPVLSARGGDEEIGERIEVWVCSMVRGSLRKPRKNVNSDKINID